MTSRNDKIEPTTGTRNDFNAELPKDDCEESVEDMLANVNQFIDSVYRDLSICPPPRSSIGSSTFRAGVSLHDVSANSSAGVSPVTLRNMDAEIEKIERICDNVDQNLRSIGVYMNNNGPNNGSDLSNTNMTSSSLSSEPIIISEVVEKAKSNNQHSQRKRMLPRESRSPQIVDLSNSQSEASGVTIQPHELSNGGDDDVIIVSADFPPVVDLCTPNSNKNTPQATLRRQLNRRRLNRYDNVDDGDLLCERPPLARQRRTESFAQSVRNKSSDSETTATTNDASRPPFMCPVCMESCLQSQPTSTLCGHVFCNKCIERAIALTHKCPMCNKKISKKQTFRIYL